MVLNLIQRKIQKVLTTYYRAYITISYIAVLNYNSLSTDSSLSDESDGYDEENVDTAEQLRSSHPEVFLRQAVLKICSNFSGEYPCRTAISIKLHAVLLKPHFGMSVLLSICCIFSEHLFLKTPLDGCV